MQSYSHPDVFLCADYNSPGITGPFRSLCSSEDVFNPTLFTNYRAPSASASSSASASRAGSPHGHHPSSPTSSSPSSSRENSRSPPATPGQDAHHVKKLGKYKRLSARANMPLLEYAAHLERKRAVHDKRKQVKPTSPTRSEPLQLEAHAQ